MTAQFKSINYLNSDDTLTSKQQDALEAKTCEECDNKCGKLDRYDECCQCRDNLFKDARGSYCDTCADECDRRSERNYESFCEDFYGGSSPVTMDEQHRVAWEQKQRLK